MNAPAIVLEDVSFTYPGTNAGVFGVDLAIGTGELVAVIGPSGCGKSTLLQIVAGFLAPARGRVLIGGKDAAGIPARERDIGVVFQNYALFPHMRAWENVAYPLRLRGRDAASRRATAHAMLERVALAAHADKYPGQLSGGQQQRVALARALVFEPQALLLDEPLSALDAGLRVEMRDEIRALQRDHGIAMLHITHDQEEALSIADRVAVMQAGRIAQIDVPRTLYDSPVNRAVATFVGQGNLWESRVTGPREVETPVGRLVTGRLELAEGRKITVLVRPEQVRVGPAPDGVNTLAGAVSRDRFLGSVRRFDFFTGGGTLLGETSQAGDISVVHIPPAAIRVLPAEQ